MYKTIGLSLMLLAFLFAEGQTAFDGYYEKEDVDGLRAYLKSQSIPIVASDNDTITLVNEIYRTVLYDTASPFYLDFKLVNDNSLFIHQNKIWLNLCELRFLYEDKFFKRSDLKQFASQKGMEGEFVTWELPERISFLVLKQKSPKFYRKILENQLGIIRDSGQKNVELDNFMPVVESVDRTTMISISDSSWKEIFLFANGNDYVPAYHFPRSYRELKPESKSKYDFLAKGIANFVFHQQGDRNAPQLPMEIFLDSRENYAIIYLSHGAVNHHLFLRKLDGKWTVLENVFGYQP